MIGKLTAWHVRWLLAARGVLATALLAGASVALAALLTLHDVTPPSVGAAAVLWLVAAVGGLTAGARLIAAEHDAGGLEGVLLAPVDRRDLFLARATAVALVTLAMLAVAWIATAALFPRLATLRDPRAGLALLAGAVGLGPLGALTGWTALTARSGEALGPALGLPLAAPLIVTGFHATQIALAEGRLDTPSLTFAAGYAVAVAGISYAVSEHVTEAPP